MGVYEDYPKSAGNLKRSGLKSLLGQVVVSPVDYILVAELDRLTRNTSNYLLLNKRLATLGTEIKTTRSGASMGDMVANIIEMVNDLERRCKEVRNRDCDNG